MNYFEELSKKGIQNIELSAEELQKLFIEGKITQDQFTKILIDNMGMSKFIRVWGDFLLESHLRQIYETHPPQDFLNE